VYINNIKDKQPPSRLSSNGEKSMKKLTNKEYIKLLVSKNIEVRPIENYISSKAKIKHKCGCGNIWEVSPNKVLIGRKCGCGHIKTDDKSYLLKLKELKIDVKPVEKYINTKVKIKHKCTCGNIWEVSPGNILKGGKCGCKKIVRTPLTYKNRDTILYYIKLNNIYKIGIIIHEQYKSPEDSIIKRRYNKNFKNKDVSIEIIDYKLYNNGEIAYLNEQEIIEMYKEEKYIGENFITSNGKSGGESECFTRNIYEDIKYYFN